MLEARLASPSPQPGAGARQDSRSAVRGSRSSPPWPRRSTPRSTRVASMDEVPEAIARYLAAAQPARARGGDARPAARRLPWDAQPTLEIGRGVAEDGDAVGVTACFAAVAETGTLMLVSGPASPTRNNFLPDTHIVVLRADQVVGFYEEAWDRLARSAGAHAAHGQFHHRPVAHRRHRAEARARRARAAAPPHRPGRAMARKLAPEERALWRRAPRDVRPRRRAAASEAAPPPPPAAPPPAPASATPKRDAASRRRTRPPQRTAPEARPDADRGAARPSRHDPGRGASRARAFRRARL